MVKKNRACKVCGARLKMPPRPTKDTPDIKKLLRIMRKYKLTQQRISELTLVAPSTVNGWLSVNVNPRGTLHREYFKRLRSKGYK